MSDFEKKRVLAQRKWDRLKSSAVPVIYLGAASCGRAAGAMEVLESVEKTLKRNRLKAKIVQVGCIGPCYLEPLMDIVMPGRPRISYADMNPQKAERVIESYLIKGDPFLKFAVGHFGDSDSDLGNGIPRFFDLPMLKPQVRVVLRNCGFIDPEEIDHYIANEGYSGIMNAFSQGPEAVIAEAEKAGLRGRGGAGFPAYRKWQICRSTPGNAAGSPRSTTGCRRGSACR